jgi:uncharacterized protein with PQ loop repeat
MFIEILNFLTAIVGVLMSLGYFPQAYKIYKNKSSKDVSLIHILFLHSAVGFGLLTVLLHTRGLLLQVLS